MSGHRSNGFLNSFLLYNVATAMLRNTTMAIDLRDTFVLFQSSDRIPCEDPT